jgi:hypothetical protein
VIRGKGCDGEKRKWTRHEWKEGEGVEERSGRGKRKREGMIEKGRG